MSTLTELYQQIPCPLSNPKNINYLLDNGNYYIKCSGWKKGKEYKTRIQLRDINSIIKSLESKIEKYKKIRDDIIDDYKHLFFVSVRERDLNKKAKLNKRKRELLNKYNIIKNKIISLEMSKSNFGIIPPTDKYYHRSYVK